jgi:glycosyltransferase involved in cell wall biosynthesis
MRRPVVIFPGDLGDARKGGALLLRAWDEIHRRCPEAVLALAGPFGLAGFHAEELIHSTLGQLNLIRNPVARAAVEVRGPGTVLEYPRWLAEAAVTVLPSFDEAFGMVVTESLASGTPVVCSSDGGPGEIITEPDIGATVPIYQYLDTMSAKRAQELAEAVLYAIDLSRKPETAGRCREWAAQWSLERVGRQAESIYEELAAKRKHAIPVAAHPAA